MMKKFFLIAAIILLSSCVSKKWAVQNYEAACFYGDIIHSAMDDSIIGKRMIEHYSEWTKDFQEYKFRHLRKEYLDSLSYCY
jgi:hypothetical protein